MIMPGCLKNYKSQPFNPAFLAGKATYRVLRFKDWQKTDDSKTVTWTTTLTSSSRCRPTAWPSA